MKTPISYYEGKQTMLKYILPLISEHKIYVEPFFGGGAVYWAKEPSKSEIINDVNMNVVNFYEVLKYSYFNLRKKVEATLHSRKAHQKASIIYECPELFADDPVIRAWAFFVCTNQGFSCMVRTWGYDKCSQKTKTNQNKIDRLNEKLSERMKYTQIECNDAHKVMLSRDSEDAFHYIDPPYVGSDQGHYGGYTEKHFERDLDVISKLKGKFLLSSYPSEQLDCFALKYGWHQKLIDKPLTASNVQGKRKRKTEVLTANYCI